MPTELAPRSCDEREVSSVSSMLLDTSTCACGIRVSSTPVNVFDAKEVAGHVFLAMSEWVSKIFLKRKRIGRKIPTLTDRIRTKNVFLDKTFVLFKLGGLSDFITLFQLFHTPSKVRKLSSHQRNSKKCSFVHTSLSTSLSLSLFLQSKSKFFVFTVLVF